MAARKSTKKSAIKQKNLTSQITNTSSALREDALRQPFSSMQASPKRKRIYIAAVVLALVVLLAFALRGYLIAAMINGQPISRLEVIGQLEKQTGKQIMQLLVRNVLISQEAHKRGVVLTEDDITKGLAKIDARLKQQGQTLAQAMKAYNISKDDVIAQQRPNFLLNKMVDTDIKVTDKEVTDFMTKNNEAYGGTLKPEQVKQELHDQKLSQKEQELIDKLQKTAKIDYFVNY